MSKDATQQTGSRGQETPKIEPKPTLTPTPSPADGNAETEAVQPTNSAPQRYTRANNFSASELVTLVSSSIFCIPQSVTFLSGNAVRWSEARKSWRSFFIPSTGGWVVGEQFHQGIIYGATFIHGALDIPNEPEYANTGEYSGRIQSGGDVSAVDYSLLIRGVTIIYDKTRNLFVADGKPDLIIDEVDVLILEPDGSARGFLLQPSVLAWSARPPW